VGPLLGRVQNARRIASVTATFLEKDWDIMTKSNGAFPLVACAKTVTIDNSQFLVVKIADRGNPIYILQSREEVLRRGRVFLSTHELYPLLVNGPYKDSLIN
jgi:hypothetical protein